MKHVELLVIEETQLHGVRVCLKPCSPEVLTHSLIKDIRDLQNSLVDRYLTSPWEGCFYVIWYSHRNHGTRGRGLDFNFIFDSIIHRKENEFENYICMVFDLLFLNYIGLGIPLLNCSIVDRKITGISQEFFLLNQINFLRKDALDKSDDAFHEVHLPEISNNFVFPEDIYKRNSFYTFYNYDLNLMQHLISETGVRIIGGNELEEIKQIFETIKNETITQIYNMASKNTKVLERLAHIQSTASVL
ncbi:hypothetical protein [Legionella spiritensis]|uniref:Uncharacterized protein n=1 Tax=Legionella spiritensis TaxID=452 RepID=A0A0W0ZB20_LEGSP|nr:hypothetical protein [Legionella spiritensis]KTD66292.1 hypothetical protein Lspi_0055 [Legionella spiritensis]SNV48508.1 Uncharacterised protein [Legionella spiritensis]VEG91503.1 Uncharacterised protein [Legionella spiritensis]